MHIECVSACRIYGDAGCAAVYLAGRLPAARWYHGDHSARRCLEVAVMIWGELGLAWTGAVVVSGLG